MDRANSPSSHEPTPPDRDQETVTREAREQAKRNDARMDHPEGPAHPGGAPETEIDLTKSDDTGLEADRWEK